MPSAERRLIAEVSADGMRALIPMFGDEPVEYHGPYFDFPRRNDAAATKAVDRATRHAGALFVRQKRSIARSRCIAYMIHRLEKGRE